MTFRRATTASVTALLVAAVTAATAGAASGTYGGKLASGQADAASSTTNLTYSRAVSPSGYQVWAGAHYPGGWDQYAGYASAYGSACHSYGTPNNWGAMLWNGTQSILTINGSWGTSNASPNHC